MTLWIDAQLSPALVNWLQSVFDVSAFALRDLGLRDASDREIFFAARREGATIMTKDGDFLRLLEVFGTPPQVIWLTCGNTSNANLKRILVTELAVAFVLLERGEPFVEIR